MSVTVDRTLTAAGLLPKLRRVFELAGEKIISLGKSWDPSRGTPVFTVRGKYTSRGWTEWTQGFQFGMPLLQFDATGERGFLDQGKSETTRRMASHVSHIGVHDHGFNNISTYGNLLRLIIEGKDKDPSQKEFCELALKVSGAVQAARWTRTGEQSGFIYSFNGPHSLFIDTMRSLRSLAVGQQLGHVLMGERDQKISLMDRLVQHAQATARHAIYYGEGRDFYDVLGRSAHESVFNVNDGSYRCPGSQQGYSPFTTWTRGLAWALCGFAEELEFLKQFKPEWDSRLGAPKEVAASFIKAASATAAFYVENTPACGVPMWDTGAPGLKFLGDFLTKPADPFNQWEPVDSSAAAIAAQGFLRLGNFLNGEGQTAAGRRFRQIAFKIANTLFDEPYLSTDPKHQGLLLHSVYHRPNGWDHVHKGQKVPNGESSMWGDYHALELALSLWREAREEPYYTFFGCCSSI